MRQEERTRVPQLSWDMKVLVPGLVQGEQKDPHVTQGILWGLPVHTESLVTDTKYHLQPHLGSSWDPQIRMRGSSREAKGQGTPLHYEQKTAQSSTEGIIHSSRH